MTTIHDRIKNRRTELGLSMEDVAEQLNVSYQTVQQWENGKTAPRRKRINQLAALLKMTPELLEFGIEAGGTDPTEAQILMFYRGMSPEARELFEQQGNALYNLSRKSGPSAADPFDGKKPPKK